MTEGTNAIFNEKIFNALYVVVVIPPDTVTEVSTKTQPFNIYRGMMGNKLKERKASESLDRAVLGPKPVV